MPEAETKIQIGRVDYFGYGGLDLRALTRRLPLRVGDSITFDDFDRHLVSLRKIVQRVTGHPPTDITATCCDSDRRLLIYIGLDGSSTRPMPSGRALHGSELIDPAAAALYQQFGTAMQRAVEGGASGEDWSQGYTLAIDPATRAIQVKVRAYAQDRDAEMRHVLESAVTRSSSTNSEAALCRP